MLEYNNEIRLSESLCNGYQYFCDSSHPLQTAGNYVLYHRHVASIKVGHWLSSDEHVHHIDGNKTNNNPENLLILTNAEHQIIEGLLRGDPNKIRNCLICNNKLSPKNKTGLCVKCYNKNRKNKIPIDVKIRKNHKYCLDCGNKMCDDAKGNLCSVCYNKSIRLFDPTKEELEKMVWEMPTTDVGKHYGVTDKAIEKRCKLLGISKPPRGYWNKVKFGKL